MDQEAALIMANQNRLNKNNKNKNNQIANALIATFASLGVSLGAAIALASPSFADTRVASLNLEVNNQRDTVTCLNDGEFYRGMVDACETLSDVEAANPYQN
jgi:cell division septal protein FtsQ